MAALATSPRTLSIADAYHSKRYNLQLGKLKTFHGYQSKLIFHQKRWQLKNCARLSVHAKYSDNSRGRSGDFFAGFMLGGALFGALAYFFAPEIRRSLLNEDGYGFQKASGPIDFDVGLEKTRQTLEGKISQLSSAIDNISSRLRTRNMVAAKPDEADLELEANMHDLELV